jgi:hypothetical protein
LALAERALNSVGYSGRFRGKPDSPCLYLPGNNGPDGCAIFVRRARFQILSEHSRVLEVWRVPSNQVKSCAQIASWSFKKIRGNLTKISRQKNLLYDNGL